MPAPPTEADAIKAGGKYVPTITQEHIEKYGAEINNPPDCSGKQPGALCAQYPCVGGQQYVIYCDGMGGCTRRYLVPC